MPTTSPRFRSPILSSLIAPFILLYYKPGLFDSYSVGMTFIQMAIPESRSQVNQMSYRQEFEKYDNNLSSWRDSKYSKARSTNFSMLDKNNGAGWELACKLLCNRNRYYRGRITAEEAL